MERRLSYKIEPEYDGERVIRYLRGKIGLSHRLTCSLKRIPMAITLNGEHIRTVDMLHTGDTLSILLPADREAVQPLKHPLEILYEDEDILAVNKEGGLPMHPSHNHQGDTLANALAHYLTEKGKTAAFRAVGRLDKGTSGIVVCALNRYCAARLSGNVQKEYLAVASGILEGSGTVDAPIYRPDPMKTYRTVDPRGDSAVTHWEAVDSRGGMTLLRVRLETGRTHQIRVHFASLGMPLVGDTMYGKADTRIDRQALHCRFCSFIHPVTGEKIELTAPLPEDMGRLFGEK